jgi:hypothetical protein
LIEVYGIVSPILRIKISERASEISVEGIGVSVTRQQVTGGFA